MHNRVGYDSAMNNKLATIALDMLTKVSVPADDNTLSAVSAVRNMLRGIATGALVVVPPGQVKKPKAVKEPTQ